MMSTVVSGETLLVNEALKCYHCNAATNTVQCFFPVHLYVDIIKRQTTGRQTIFKHQYLVSQFPPNNLIFPGQFSVKVAY